MIYLDVTELVQNPLRTGIQRVVRKLLAKWRGDKPLVPCVFDAVANSLLLVPDEAVEIITEQREELKSAQVHELQQMLQAIRARRPARPVDPPAGKLLVPELFFDPARCAYYARRLRQDPAGTHFLVHDFIPWLHPEAVRVDDASPFMHYLNVIQAARSLAFVSETSRREWAERIVRRKDAAAQVISNGADGLDLPRQTWRPDRRAVVCIGSLDGRRNQHLIVRAFQRLWSEGGRMPLEIVGHAFHPSHPVAAEVIAASHAQTLLTLTTDATDAELGEILERARATIFASSIEGFGLPPVESLYAGIPVIVTADVPSIVGLPPRGQIRLAEISEDAIYDALLQISDDNRAAALWKEARGLRLPTWSDFADNIERWLCGDAPDADPA